MAFLGPNGAGKSTTIDMMLGLTRPDQGHVTLFGMAPADAVKAGAVGVMLQTGALIRDLSVRELITMMASLYPDPLDVDEVLDLARLRDVAERRTQKLSGGETQRIRFAVALVSDPDLLLLDEPTVALDVEARHGFWTVMRGFAARGKTVLFATHYLEEADAYADRVVLMARGRVIADGPPTEIKSRVGRRILRATLTGVDVAALDALPGVLEAVRHGDERRRCGARTVTPPCGRCSTPTPARTTSRSRAQGSKKRSWSSPRRRRRVDPATWRSHDEHDRLHPLRTAAHRSATSASPSSRSCSRSSCSSSSPGRTATNSSTAFRSPPTT